MNQSVWCNNFSLVAERQNGGLVIGTPMGLVMFVVLMTIAAIAVLFFYGQDLRTKQVKHRVMLWGLRVLGLACLAMVLLEPTMAWKRTVREEASIAVLLDASASMGLTDKLRDPKTRFAMAKLHDMLTDDQLQQALSGKPEDQILTEQQSKQVDGLTRMAVALDLLRSREGDLLRRLATRFNVKALRFGLDVAEMSSVSAGPAPDKRIVMEEDKGGARTDISVALKAVEKLTASERVVGTLLITDGDWNSGGDPQIAAEKLGAEGIPVFCVGMGNPDQVRDIEVADVKVKKSVYLKDTVAVAAEVKWSGYEDVTIAIALRQGEEVLQEKKLELKKGARLETVGLQFVPKQVGVVSCTVEVPPLADEVRSDNNRKSFEVEVTRTKKKVLVVEKFPRWEWRFLKNAIDRDPDFDLTCLLFNGMGRPSEGDMYITSFPTTKKELYEFEVIIFGDVPATEFAPQQLELIASYVEEKGAPFIMIAGERYAPWSYAGTPIEKLLPVLLDTGPNGKTGVYFDNGFNVELTAEGWDSPVMQLSDVLEENNKVWMEMPPSYWCASVERARAGATVLAVHPFLSNKYGKLPLIATQHYGNGKTMIVNVDSTWRWRLEHGDIVHYRFWGNVLRWMVAAPLEGKGKYVTLSSDKERYQVGESATIHAKVLDKEYYPFSKGQVFVEVADTFGRSERLAMELTDAKKGLYQARYPIRASGAYVLQSAVPSLGDEGFQAAIKIFGEEVSLERNSLQMNKEVLERIAAKTGGKFHTIETAAAIPDEIPWVGRESSEVKLKSLWDSYYAIAAFLGIMTLEWVLRKRKGYV
jgi:uncharacterized membrane protein